MAVVKKKPVVAQGPGAPLTKGERTKERILDAAESAFAQRGFKAASLRDIAAEGQIHQPGLYKHFDSKEALYSAVLNRALQPLIDMMNERIIRAPTADASQQAPAAILDLLAAHSNVSALIFQALIAKDDAFGRDIVMEWMDMMLDRGGLVGRRVNPDVGGPEMMLISICMMTMVHARFLLAPLLTRFYGGTEDSPELTAMWKRLLSRLNESLFAAPPKAMPLAKLKRPALKPRPETSSKEQT